MSQGLNRVMAIGNLGADPELKFTQAGQSVLRMRIAVNESWHDKESGERKERVEWLTCILWGKRGEGLSKHIGKGDRVYVEGRLQTRSWDDKEGQRRYTTEVNVRDVILLGGKGGERGSSEQPPRSQPSGGGQSLPDDGYGGGDFGDDDIPFGPADERLS